MKIKKFNENAEVTDREIMIDYLDHIEKVGAINSDNPHYGATMDCFPRKRNRSKKTEVELKTDVLNILKGGDGISDFAYNQLKKDL